MREPLPKKTTACKSSDMRIMFSSGSIFMRFVTKLSLYTSVLAASILIQGAVPSSAPQVDQRPYSMEIHGDTRVDPYYWLRDREDPQVLAHLEAENRYTKEKLRPAAHHATQLFREFSARVPRVKDSARYAYHGYEYWTRSYGDRNYPLYMRARSAVATRYLTPYLTPPAPEEEEVVLDVNQLAQGSSYFDLGQYELSSDDRYLAYSFDTVGRRKYALKVVERTTGETLLKVENTTGSFEWFGNDLYYTVQDPETLREFQVYRIPAGTLSLGGKPHYGPPELVFEEADETFYVSIEKSLTEKTLFIHSASTVADEWRYLSADQDQVPQLIQPRQRGVEYQVKDGGDRFYILTNFGAQDFQVMEVGKENPQSTQWKVIVPGEVGRYREGLSVFKDYVVIFEKFQGQDVFRVIDRKTAAQYEIPFSQQVSVAGPFTNLTYDTSEFLYTFESLKTPPSVYSFDLAHRTTRMVHQDSVLGYDENRYEVERVWVPARDGTLIPMSLVAKKGLPRDGRNPALIYGYGSYGVTIEPTFSSKRISLLDRGFVYAIAHVRGGAMLGRSWYEQGKLLQKKNTFFDFIDCSRYLVDQKWTSPEHLYAQGGSAGGLLMGAVVNMAPQLYRGVIAEVPFVDVVTTMLDESIPLTTAEYDEWGDPRDRAFYEYMLSYSPYDNVTSQSYPNLLVTSGLHDSQVQYWEPTKWVARLRDHNTGSGLVLLKTNMQAGHGGASGQIEGFREIAEEWSFFLHLEEAQRRELTLMSK